MMQDCRFQTINIVWRGKKEHKQATNKLNVNTC